MHGTPIDSADSQICNVWSENLESVFEILRELILEFPYISMVISLLILGY